MSELLASKRRLCTLEEIRSSFSDLARWSDMIWGEAQYLYEEKITMIFHMFIILLMLVMFFFNALLYRNVRSSTKYRARYAIHHDNLINLSLSKLSEDNLSSGVRRS